jgi:hypothetical protein
MGHSHSKASITEVNNQVSVNDTDIKTSQEQINSQISNTTIDAAKNCSADLNLQQAVNISHIRAKGDFNYSSNQKQVAALTFRCLNSSTVRQSAGSNIITKMTNDIAANATAEALSIMKAQAASQAKQGFLGIGGSSSNANTKITNNTTNINKTNIDISNVVKNVVENNFSSEDLQTCISQANNDQSVTIGDVEAGGNVILALNQDQAVTVVSNCIQESNISNKITNGVASALGISVEATQKSVSKQDTTGSADSKATTQGVGDAIGDVARGVGQGVSTGAEGIGKGIGDVVTSFGDILKGLFGNPLFIVLCCVCVIVIGIVAYIAINKGGDVVAQNPELLMA